MCFLVTLHTLVPSHVIFLFSYFNCSICTYCSCLGGAKSCWDCEPPPLQGQKIMELYLLPPVTLDGLLQRHRINFTSSVWYNIKSDIELLETNNLFWVLWNVVSNRSWSLCVKFWSEWRFLLYTYIWGFICTTLI